MSLALGKKATQLPEIASSGWPENLSSENTQAPKAETTLICTALPGKLGKESLSSARTALTAYTAQGSSYQHQKKRWVEGRGLTPLSE